MTADRVVLWRHGRTAHNHGDRWQGQLDTELDDVGRVQAKTAAAVLARLVDSARSEGAPVTLVSSDLRRARATAAALGEAAGLAVVEDVRLREIHAGTWQGLSRQQIVDAGMGEQLAAWRRGEDIRVGGTERRSEASIRTADAVAEHARAQSGGLLVVVSHGGVLAGATMVLTGLPADGWRTLAVLGNCHWGVLEPGTRRWRLLAHNLTAEHTGP